MIQISGTHGVEGFAGSAIQCSLLESIQDSVEQGNNKDLPSIVFVHALNPYGFANLRRYNENNVDLNRNLLSQQEFDEVTTQDPNHSGYVDHMDFINPTKSLETKLDFFYLRAIYTIWKNGFVKTKKTLVSGNYHFPQSLFYGGQELQQSHVILKEFLQNQFDMSGVEVFGLIDIHTGLGPSGFDTIVLHSNMSKKEGEEIFGGPDNEFLDHLSHLKSDGSPNEADKAMSGYANVTGFVSDGVPAHSCPSNTKILSITHEFGTVPGLLVFKALRAEKAMYQYHIKNRSPKYDNLLG